MGFNTETIAYPSANSLDRIAARLFFPDDIDLRGVVQISHGMCEYIDRYREFAEFLCQKGFLVCGNDHLGHRHSVTDDSKLGFFAEKEGGRCLVEDVFSLMKIVKERYPGLPYFLLGHSMGSFIARCFLEEHGEELNGALLSGTGGPNPMAAMGVRLAGLLCRTQGPRRAGKLLEKLAFGKYNERFEGRTKQDWLSRDKDKVDEYRADPYCRFSFSNAAYRDLFELSVRCNGPAWALRVPKSLPIYLFSGSDDPVGDYGRGVKKVYQMLKEAGVFDVTLKLYQKGRHEMLNELNRAEVYEDVYDWIRRKLP